MGGRRDGRAGDEHGWSTLSVSDHLIYIPAQLVHQEINESEKVPVASIVVRSGDNVVENVVTADQLAEAERGG